MTRQELIALCLTLPNSYEAYPYGGFPGDETAWTVMRHRENDKGFAFLFRYDGSLCANVKCEPMRGDFLRHSFSGIEPAYHMNKEHWIMLRTETVASAMLQELIENSYHLTEKKGRSK